MSGDSPHNEIVEDQPTAGEQSAELLAADSSEAAEAEYVNSQPMTRRRSTEMRIQASVHSGPLPPPEILAEYDRVVPGLAERIVKRFELQSDHRMQLESRVVRSDAFSQRLGAIAGSLIALVAIGGGIYLSYIGKDTAGLGTIITAVVGLLGAFGFGKWSHDKALERQAGEGKFNTEETQGIAPSANG